MSYTSDVKNELCMVKGNTNDDQITLEAMLRLNSEIIKRDGEFILNFETTSNAVARRFLSLTREFFDCEIVMLKKHIKKLNQKDRYVISVNTMAEAMIDMFNLFYNETLNKDAIIDDVSLTKDYLRGSFITRGAVNNPNTSNYHLEIASKNSNEAVFIQTLFNNLELDAKITKRRNDYVVYIKSSQKIIDFLRLIGCSEVVFKFEDEVLSRNFNQDINRIMNFDIANEMKSQSAARKQLGYIQYLEYYYPVEKLDSSILLVMQARKKYPESSLQELADAMGDDYGFKITKSGLNHKFRKIKQIAIEHKEGK